MTLITPTRCIIPTYRRHRPTSTSRTNGNDNSFSVLTSLFGDNSKGAKGGGGGGIAGVAVNSYLWHASLDTMSFMPIASADPFGGTIITDWYSPRGTPNERFKVNIFILNRELRADGVRVTVFRQVKDAGGQWTDAPVDPKTNRDLENSILTRARQLRLSDRVQLNRRRCPIPRRRPRRNGSRSGGNARRSRP